jgi:flagellar hook-associated protein 1 FlgK
MSTTPPARPASSGRLQQLADGMAANRPFDPAAMGKPNAEPDGLRRFLDQLAGSPAQGRQRRGDLQPDAAGTQRGRAMSNVNGVNMDDEMSFMMQIERTFSASSKVITAVDQMLKSFSRL